MDAVITFEEVTGFLKNPQSLATVPGLQSTSRPLPTYRESSQTAHMPAKPNPWMVWPCHRSWRIPVNPQMVTNSFQKRGFPKWDFFSLPTHFQMGIPIWKRGSPYGKHSHVGIFWLIPKWARTHYGNGLVTEPSLYGNGYPFLYG